MLWYPLLLPEDGAHNCPQSCSFLTSRFLLRYPAGALHFNGPWMLITCKEVRFLNGQPDGEAFWTFPGPKRGCSSCWLLLSSPSNGSSAFHANSLLLLSPLWGSPAGFQSRGEKGWKHKQCSSKYKHLRAQMQILFFCLPRKHTETTLICSVLQKCHSEDCCLPNPVLVRTQIIKSSLCAQSFLACKAHSQSASSLIPVGGPAPHTGWEQVFTECCVLKDLTVQMGRQDVPRNYTRECTVQHETHVVRDRGLHWRR